MAQTKYLSLLESSRKGLSGGNVVQRDGTIHVKFYGSHAFSTTDTDVEVSLTDESSQSLGIATADILSVVLTIKDGTPVADDLLSTDGAITSDALTVFRPAGTTSALAFYYEVIAKVAPKYLR